MSLIEGLQQTILGTLREKDPIPAVLGQREVKEKILVSLLAGHHVLLEGPPGVGKTTLIKSIANLLPPILAIKGCAYHCSPDAPVCPLCKSNVANKENIYSEEIPGGRRFVRIQGSPDLTAEDLLGDIDPSKAFKYGPQDYRSFAPGKLLKGNRGIIFFDELNRVQEKLQNALLQVLEEGIATIGPYEIDYPANFVMVATMNPREHAGVEDLSDVLLDRFDVIKIGYPETPAIEKQILQLYGKRFGDVLVPDEIVEMIVTIVRATREEPWKNELLQGASVRAGLSLYERVQTIALLNDKNQADIDSLRALAPSSLASRIKVAPEGRYYENPFSFIDELCKAVLK